jgi:hypothetical protein
MKDFLRGYRGPALFAALSFLLIHCSALPQSDFGKSEDAVKEKSDKKTSGGAGGADDDDDATSSGTTAPVKKPDPDLKFAFDAHAKTIQAKVKPAFAKGTLFVDVFAIEHGEAAPLDCAHVKQNGTSVDLSKASGSGTYLTLDVPTNASFLSNRLDGTIRTAIQGCVFDATGNVTTKYATSLMNAWDNEDAVASASPRVYHGIEAYANGCMDELGELPMFANGDFKCDAEGMQVVPITATDNNGNVTVLDETTTNWPLTSAQRAATQRCDRPAWLGYDGDVSDGTTSQCAPFTRIGQYQNSRGTRFIFICRRESVRPLGDKTFENINFIAHNPTSGKTCYFNNHLDGTVTDGTKIPRPDAPTSDVFWMDMGSIVGQRCPSCHDSDPWMHSPWVDGAVDKKTGHTIVPKQGEDPAYNLQTKYSIFGRESFLVDQQSQTDWKEPTMLTDVGSCGTCHRIGTGMTMQMWSQRSVGEQNDMADFLTPAFQTSAKLHWMPEDATAMRKIDACADRPGSCAEAPVPH